MLSAGFMLIDYQSPAPQLKFTPCIDFAQNYRYVPLVWHFMSGRDSGGFMKEIPGFIMDLRSLIFLSLLLLPSGLRAGGSEGLAVPRHFIPNTGQWHSSVRYGAIGTNAKVAFTDHGVHLFVPSTLNQNMNREHSSQSSGDGRNVLEHIYIEFDQPSSNFVVTGGQTICSNINVYHGSNQETWRTGMPGVESVRYSGLWEGIDITFRFENGRLVPRTSHACLMPILAGFATPFTADPRRAKCCALSLSMLPSWIRWTGISSRSIRPDLYRETDLSSWRYLTRTEFCTFFGGSEHESPLAIAVDDSSRLSFVMETFSMDLPLLHPVQSTLRGSSDIYIANDVARWQTPALRNVSRGYARRWSSAQCSIRLQ
jgi:hypothetical protein